MTEDQIVELVEYFKQAEGVDPEILTPPQIRQRIKRLPWYTGILAPPIDHNENSI